MRVSEVRQTFLSALETVRLGPETFFTALAIVRLGVRVWRRLQDRRVRAAIIRNLSAACTDQGSIETDHWARIGWELDLFLARERPR